MTDHAWILENLAAYLADGLEPAERGRLEQHVNECMPCAAVLADSRALDTTLTALFHEARPNAAMEDRLVQALRRPRRRALRLPIPAWLAVAAAALVLIGLTGAAASRILVRGNVTLPENVPTGSMVGTLLGYQRYQKEDNTSDADELAWSSRKSILSSLQSEQNEPEGTDLDPTKDFINRRNASISDGTSNALSLDKKAEGYLTKDLSSPALRPPSVQDKPYGDFTRDGSVRAIGGKGAGYLWGGEEKKKLEIFARTETYLSQGFQPGKLLDKHEPEVGLQNANETLGAGKAPPTEKPPIEKPKLEKPADKPAEQPGPRKIIIRSGEIEYEVQSFDAAVATVARLVKPIKGGFIATVNSDKLANGKVRGSVVVRVPPESLDELILELRSNLGKSGELKSQRIGSRDITKQYTDLESELRAARAMEERLLQIIKTGKGEIKDLLAAEKELGTWRTRIEKIEGELRYYAHQVALSTLTILLYEKEISAPFGAVEREQVQMGLEVEEVDQAYQAAQKAVREAKGRITRAELKQPTQGQFSALLDFEVSPEAAGPLRDRLKQLGSVARFDITRQEESEGGSGKPSNGTVKRSDTRFHVHFYNLTDVPPRETMLLSLACVDVETALKTLLGRVEKAAGRVVASNLNSGQAAQTSGEVQFQVKTTLAEAVLDDVKKIGEVTNLQVRETTNAETTAKKRGFVVRLWAVEAAMARQSEEIQLACVDVAVSYRRVQDAVAKLKGRVRTAQMDEQDRRKVTATLDFDIRRADAEAFADALAKTGEVYTRKISRAADAENVVDSKIHLTVTFLNQANIPPRETYVFGVEVADVDQTAAMLSGLAGKREGRTLEANVARESNGRVTGNLIYDVPMVELPPLLEALKAAGTVRVQRTEKHPEIPDSPLAIARLKITLSNKALLVPSDGGFGSNVQRGLSDSFTILSWSLRFLILGLCVLLPWALVTWGIYRLVVRMRRRTSVTA